jgi:predicted unusual protein kinase regulating ubiquinone biosynthesis (AarF/ABC1/UbiB family)
MWWLIGAAAVGAIAWRARRRSLSASLVSSPLTATSRTGRNAEMARLGARVGGGAASNRARWLFASAERKEALNAELELRTAEDIAATLGNMKGALMKLGQLASFVDDGMPEPVREALEQLQADAPPMSAALAAEVVTKELGAPPAAVFAEWDPVPIAAASIGQVHRALTQDGRAVAVKVQYPGVEDAIRADLETLGTTMAPAGMFYRNFDVGPLVDELRERIGEELDYGVEADHQRRFAEYYRGHPFIHVPNVVDDLSTGRVLTTDLAAGARFAELDQWTQPERDLAGEAIFRFVYRSLYRMHAFNGDPHPGNYLFRPGGRVTFLDFGLVKHYSDDEIDQELELARSMVVEPDLARARRATERAGYYPPGAPLSDQEMFDYGIIFWEMVQHDERFRFTPEYASEVVRRYGPLGQPTYGAAVKYSNLPARWVVLQRIQVGLVAVLGRLQAEANWQRISREMWPFTDGPPSTPLGEEEAAWWATRRDWTTTAR